MQTRIQTLGQKTAYEAALETALAELEAAQARVEVIKGQLSDAETKVTELTDLVQSLMRHVPAHRVGAFVERLNQVRSNPQPNPRSGEVFDNVIQLFAQRPTHREWTASDVQAALSHAGVKADPKAVYNVLNYLAKKGRLRRIARGQYLIVDLGIGIHTGDDFETVSHGDGRDME